MAVYRFKNSPYWQYDFQLKGRRYFGSTNKTNKRDAEKVERDIREAARAEKAEATPRRGVVDLTIDQAVTRYFDEVGCHEKNARETRANLARLSERLGTDLLLADLSDDDVARVVSLRRQDHAIWGGQAGKELVSNATVNRTVTELLRRVCIRAVLWKVRFEQLPTWKAHKLAEPKPVNRELRGDEGERLEAAIREDYQPYFSYVRQSLQRRNECLLKWSEVDWDAGLITRRGKGDEPNLVPITSAIREILWPLRDHHPEFVFTYVCQRTRKGDGHVKGQRYPLTVQGVKTEWTRARAEAGVTGFRLHDFRHDGATKLLRREGNLALVQKALNHRNIETTARYAHVLHAEVAAALEGLQESRKKSQTKSQSRLRLAG